MEIVEQIWYILHANVVVQTQCSIKCYSILHWWQFKGLHNFVPFSITKVVLQKECSIKETVIQPPPPKGAEKKFGPYCKNITMNQTEYAMAFVLSFPHRYFSGINNCCTFHEAVSNVKVT
jgi:hypothetical protein